MALQTLAAKVTPETKEQWNKAHEESGANTANQFIEMLLESFLNPKTKPVPVPTDEQAAALEAKQAEISRLKTELDLINSGSQENLNRVSDLQTEIENLKAEINSKTEIIQALENKPAGLMLEPNQEIITIPPVVSLVLDKEAAIAKQKSGKDYTRTDILLNTFWDGIVKGRSYPFKIWTKRDLEKIKQQLKPAE
jgi:uncharacterized coiled-coil DUF342 family protein